jgi:hypothetical protein
MTITMRAKVDLGSCERCSIQSRVSLSSPIAGSYDDGPKKDIDVGILCCQPDAANDQSLLRLAIFRRALTDLGTVCKKVEDTASI